MGLARVEHPCWYATCDRCGEGDNAEYETSFHHPSKAKAEDNLRDMDWAQALDGSWLCSDCYGEAITEQYACPHGAGCIGFGCCLGTARPVPFTARHAGGRRGAREAVMRAQQSG